MTDNQNPINPQNPNQSNTPVGNDPSTPSTSGQYGTPPAFSNSEDTSQQEFPQNSSPNSNQGDSIAAPSDILNQTNQENIITSPHAPQKYGGKKIIATIFGVLILIGGVTAGVILVQRQQQINERAASGRECQQAADCILLDNPGNSGTFSAPEEITNVAVTAKDVYTYQPGLTEDGCYRVKIEGREVNWQRYGKGPNCKDVSNVQVRCRCGKVTPTVAPTQPPQPQITAECSEVKSYNITWKPLSVQELNKFSPGKKVRFTVSGTSSSGTFDKARFSVNMTNLGETTLKKPGTEEFYIEYTIPAGTTDFTVSAQIHHSELGWF